MSRSGWGGSIWDAAKVPRKERDWWQALADDLSHELDMPFVVAESVMHEEWEVVCKLPGGLQLGVDSFNDLELGTRLEYFGRTEFQRWNGALDGPHVRIHRAGRQKLTGWFCDVVGLLAMLDATGTKAVSS